jgi:hypothetical protein
MVFFLELTSKFRIKIVDLEKSILPTVGSGAITGSVVTVF